MQFYSFYFCVTTRLFETAPGIENLFRFDGKPLDHDDEEPLNHSDDEEPLDHSGNKYLVRVRKLGRPVMEAIECVIHSLSDSPTLDEDFLIELGIVHGLKDVTVHHFDVSLYIYIYIGR